jgi:hypothetical protein
MSPDSIRPVREPTERSVRRVETYEAFVRRVAHENADTILEHVTNLEAEVERLREALEEARPFVARHANGFRVTKADYVLRRVDEALNAS